MEYEKGLCKLQSVVGTAILSIKNICKNIVFQKLMGNQEDLHFADILQLQIHFGFKYMQRQRENERHSS